MISLAEFQHRMSFDGWMIFPGVVSAPLISQMLSDLDEAWNVCRAIQTKNGVSSDADLTLHHLIAICGSFIRLLEEMEPLDRYFESYFGGKYILNSFGRAINTSGHTS